MECLPLCCDVLRVADRQTSKPARALQRVVLSSLLVCVFPWKYISTPAFFILFIPAPLLNAQGYWLCLNLSERSSSAFLVKPVF